MEMDMNGVAEAIVEHHEKMKKTVYIEDDHYVINVKYEYNIPRANCSTQEQLLGWVAHLTEKNWMSIDVMRYFMQVVSADRNFNLRF